MDFNDTPEQAAFRAEARAFLDAHAPLRTDASGGMVALAGSEGDDPEVLAASRAWQRTLYEAGWGAIGWPAAYGGRDATFAQISIWNEELARYRVPPSICTIGINILAPSIMVHGTEAQKERYLRPMARGDEVWVQLWSEPDAGSDLASLKTRAERTADGWVLNGQKVWSSGAHYSELGLIITRSDPDVPKHKGISAFIVDMRTPGIAVRPLKQMTGGAHFNEVFFSDVRLPSDALVGEANGGWAVAQTTLMNERFSVAKMDLGELVAPLLELARKTGAIEDPVVRQELGRLWCASRAITLTSFRTTTKMVRGGVPGPEASTIKLAWADLASAISTLGVRMCGPAGLLPGVWADQLLFSFAFHIGGGTDEIQRNIIGERVLGLPREPQVDRAVPFRELRIGTLR